MYNLSDLNKKQTGSVFIIAELSANHNQKFELAVKTIEAAKKAGADAIKLQTYKPDTITLDCNNEYFLIKQKSIWDGQRLYDLYKEAYTPWEWHEQLKKVAEKLDLIFFSSPFDFTAVDFLEKLKVPLYKIASPEISDIPLIQYVAKKGKPIILSTGVAEEVDIDLAVRTCLDCSNSNIVLLKCTSAYPTPYSDVNLNAIPLLKSKYGLEVGLSDHTLGDSVPIAAVALGAKVVEKHFILDRNLGSPDSLFSMEPKEFARMVKSIRNVEKSLGLATLSLTEKQKLGRIGMRSLFVSKPIKKGEIFTSENIKSVRPNYGLHPVYYYDVLGKKATKDLEFGQPLKLSDVDL